MNGYFQQNSTFSQKAFDRAQQSKYNDKTNKSIIERRVKTGGNWRMKSTGIIRKVDELGRIVLPIELRRTLDIDDNDSLEIFIEENTIILKKYQPACIFCGNARDVSS